jgi:hypothetical protein
LSLEPRELLLFVIVERGRTSHDQPGGSPRRQRFATSTIVAGDPDLRRLVIRP